MNTKALAKLYGHLTPRQRLPLIIAAEARGDKLEQHRLCDSAPIRHWKFSDYLMPRMALNTLTLMYITEQLDHLATYWHAVWRLFASEDKRPLDWKLSADASAYVFSCNMEAWKRFCDGLNIDASLLTAGNYLGWMLTYAEAHMPNVAPSRDDLRSTLRQCGVEDPNPVTTDDLLASWRRLFDACTGQSMGADSVGESQR